MNRKSSNPLSSLSLPTAALSGAPLVLALVLLNQILNVGATACFAFSGLAQNAMGFVLWQVLGSVFGLGTQLTFAGLVRFFSLRFANAIGIGLAFVSAQIFSAYWLLKEPFSPIQWLGTLFVAVGILLIALGKG
jgi:drug/metabolite transporter (DMT)-like permease